MALNAVVARSTSDGLAYLKARRSGAGWVSKAYEADLFINVREATRAALVLPAPLRAFALPLAWDAST